MKRITIILTLLFAVLATAASAGETSRFRPVTATLTLPHSTVLPGVPFDMVVRLRNDANEPATVGLIARLYANDANGNVLLAPRAEEQPVENDRNIAQLEPAGYGYVVLAPGQSVDRVIDWEYSMPGWSTYAALSAPGTYELSLELERGPEAFEDIVNYVGKLRTTTARLERVIPDDDDAALWKRMHDVANGKWADVHITATKSGFALGEEIVRMHPTSAYYPYALILTRVNATPKRDDIALLREAASRFADSPAHAHLLKRAGDIAAYEARIARRVRNDLTEAARFFAEADQYYREALKTQNAAVRPAVEERLRHVSASNRAVTN